MSQLTASEAAVETIKRMTRNRIQLVDMIVMNQLSGSVIENEAQEGGE